MGGEDRRTVLRREERARVRRGGSGADVRREKRTGAQSGGQSDGRKHGRPHSVAVPEGGSEVHH